MDEGFDWPGGLRQDLLAHSRRLERLEIAPKVRLAEEAAPRHAAASGQPLWKRVAFYLVSLRRLTGTRHRVIAHDDEIANLRKAVVSVMESELAAVAQATVALIGRVEQAQAEARAELAGVREDMARLDEQLRGAEAALKNEIGTVESLVRFERRTRQRAFGEFDRRLTLKPPPAAAIPEAPAAERPPGMQSLLDSFYFLLEERYRGTREEIKQRLEVYRNDLRAARERTGMAGPVVDIGCGRGELVELLTEDGFRAVGVDSSEVQLAVARQHGAAVIQGDAMEYLRSLETGSVLAVTGMHIVEHIPFPELARLMQEVARVLKKGGVALFETPNPRNLIVGATTFHLDPTHIRPLPPEVLQVLLETIGFARVEIRSLHPSDTLEYMVRTHGLDRHIATLLFGPQDYAAIGVMD